MAASGDRSSDGGAAKNPDSPPTSRTYVFSLGRTAYGIDLDDVSAREFDTAIGPYLGAADAIGQVRFVPAPRTDRRTRANADDMREWARSNGIYTVDGDRVPVDVIAAYNAWRYAVQGGERERGGRSRHASRSEPPADPAS